MTAMLAIVAPVFAIIAIGYLSARTGYLSVETGRGVADFAFMIAIPALLFKTVLLARFGDVAPYNILGSFFGASAVVWSLSALATRLVLRRPAADGPAIAMCAVFGNTIMLGLPIGVAAFGSDALAPISVVLAVHAPVFLVSATVHQALVETRPGESLRRSIIAVMTQLATQPLIIAIASAGLWRATGIELPAPLLTMVDMLSKAGVPAALLALGMSLTTFAIKGDVATLSVMLMLKLVVQPSAAAFLAFEVFALPPVSAAVVVLLAALPAGANAYLFSVKSGHAMNSASGAVALGTAIAGVSLAVLIGALKPAP